MTNERILRTAWVVMSDDGYLTYTGRYVQQPSAAMEFASPENAREVCQADETVVRVQYIIKETTWTR